MRGQFRHLHFKTFPMTPITPQCEVFWPFNLSSEFSGVLEDSKFPLLGVWASPSHLAQSGVATRLVEEELAYDRHSLTADADNVEDKLNDDQRNAYEIILNVVTNKEGKLFFVYGNGGIGKTFVWTTLLSRL